MRKLAVIAMGAALMATPAFAQPMSNPGMQGATPSPMSQMPMNQAPAAGAMPMQGGTSMQGGAPTAQTTQGGSPMARPMREGRPMRHSRPMRHDRMDRQAMGGSGTASQGDVNAAYMGGGVILQGAPGAPAPMPEPTPPGQVPANAVQVR